MGRDRKAVGVGPRGQLPHLGEAAHVADVGLQDIDGSRLDRFPEAVAGLKVLAAGNRDRAGRLDLTPRERVIPRAWLFKPPGVERRQLTRQPLRLDRREPSVTLDEWIDARPAGLSPARHDPAAA